MTLSVPKLLAAVTSPLPAGAAHVPSPRQNVDEDALVPELRFATGKLPVTALDDARLIAPNAIAVPLRLRT
jgi:hypothetical protein